MSERIKKINELIRRELFKIIIKEIDLPQDNYLTLTKVDTSPDLKYSKIYVSIMPEKDSKRVLNILNQEIYYLQQKLNKRLIIKSVPKISFVLEKETVSAGRIEEILEKLKQKK